jgi:hypothetical protein
MNDGFWIAQLITGFGEVVIKSECFRGYGAACDWAKRHELPERTQVKIFFYYADEAMVDLVC